ncbi:MAG: sigma-54-dependent Fis family transcriptional regulator, partial [Bacteroidales bacterium]|nr:sigma-54-dependent Fis family transcriptional regulator [Bacteroidales bacterium]
FPVMPLRDVTSIAVKDAESRAIRQVMEIVKGNKTKAASMLDIDYKTLLTKIKAYGINT